MPTTHEGVLAGAGRRFAIVASRFNDTVVDKLVAGAIDALRRTGVADGDVEVFRCPGALEIPALARRIAEADRFDGVVCLGAVIRGDTAHFDVVVRESTGGVARVAESARCAVSNGILTCDTPGQAMDRAGGKAGNKGADAARAAVEMADLYTGMASGRLASVPGTGAAVGRPRLGHLGKRK